MLTLLFLVYLTILLVTYHIISTKFYWAKKRIRSFVFFPIVGSLKMLSLQMSIGDFLWNVYKKAEEPLVGFHICGTPSVLIKDIYLVKRVLVRDFENFNYRTVLTTHEGDRLGSSLLFMLRGNVWTTMRKNFSSSFTTDRLRLIYPTINTIGDNMVKYVKHHEGEPLEAKETSHKFSTDVIIGGAFGKEVNCFDNYDTMSRAISRKVFECNIWRGVQFICYFLLPNLAKTFSMKFIEKSASEFMQRMIQEIGEYRERYNIHKKDFVGRILVLLKRNMYVHDKSEIIAQGMQFWVAGFETTGSTTMFLLHELAHHPHIQEKLRDEIRRTLKENDGIISYDKIRNMTYLDMVTTETLRKYPVLPFLDRVCVSDYQIPNTNITIEGGTNVYISLQGLHYDPNNFPEPYKFNPERFHPDKKLNSTFAYLPFGEGPRHCIGLRFGKIAVLVAVVKILSNFKVIPVNTYKDLEFDGRTFLLSPKKPIYLKFESLENKIDYF